VLCLGDVNINLLKTNCPDSVYFSNMYKSINMSQLISQPTRITDNSRTLIDIILASDASIVSDSGVDFVRFADHETIYCELEFETTQNSPIFKTVRDFKSINCDAFENDLKTIAWQSIFYMENVNDKVDFISDSILWLFDTHSPAREIRLTRKSAPWITDTIRTMIKQKKKARKRYERLGTDGAWKYYRSVRNHTNKSIEHEKVAYFDFVVGKHDGKALWKKLGGLHVNPSKRGNRLPDHLCEANAINDFFLDGIPQVVADRGIKEFYDSSAISDTVPKFKFYSVEPHLVSKVINQIRSNAAGHDRITIEMIKMCCPTILPYLTHIINCCLLDGSFPSSWKTAIVRPIAKIKNPVELKDLRPISVLPTLSKVLEKIIDIQLRQYFDTYSILPTCQSGFRKYHSCTTALLNVSDDLLAGRDKGCVSILALLDFSKAFDTIDHCLMISILSYVGLSDNTIRLFESYLQNRVQTVDANGSLSRSRLVERGVPQGSILGPLLFTLYTSCLPECVKFSRIQMYADDTQLYHTFDENSIDLALQQVQDDLAAISKWSEGHALVINPSKSQLMIFGSFASVDLVKRHANLSINGIRVPIVDEAKNLGLLMDSTFRYDAHILKCIQRAYMSLKLIYPHRSYLTISTKKMLCDSLVLSNFSFCSEVYDSCLKSELSSRIQRVQNSCLRLIFGIRKYDRVSYKLPQVGWLNMRDRRFLQRACLYHRIIQLRAPTYLFKKISFRTDVHNLNLRFRGTLTPPVHRSALFERSFSYQISKIYNDIPYDFKNLSLYGFKRKLRERLFNKYKLF